MDKAHLDFETGSPEELRGQKSVGVHRYAENPHTRVWGFRYRIGKGPIGQWRPGWPDPVDLLLHIMSGGIVVAHNAMFERIIWRMMKLRYGLQHWPDLPAEQQQCTMARAAAKALPLSLEDLGIVLGLKHQKDMEGSKAMMAMAKPKILKDGTMEWRDDAATWDRNMEYCGQDVLTEDEVDSVVPELTPHEQALWVLDQKINDRGIPLDVSFITRAVDLVAYAKKRADQRMKDLTGGAAKKCTEVAKILAWINSRGVQAATFKKGDHDDIILIADMHGDETVREVVELRRSSAKTSTAKFVKMLVSVGADGRGRGGFQYHGAQQTGRWAGRLWQPQNLVRIDWEKDGPLIEYALWCMEQRAPLAQIYDALAAAGDPLVMLSKCIRPAIRAEPDKVFFGGDFSNIEGRMNAFLSGEEWKLQAFRDYDNGTGPDLYKLAYSKSFGVPVEQIGKGHERQIGKVQELALGYQGGVGAFITMGDTYNVKPEDLVKPVRNATPNEAWDKVAETYASATNKFELPEDQWTAISLIVAGWRKGHPNTTQSWWDLQDAGLAAVETPHTIHEIYHGRARYMSDGNYLYCQLPSGRVICYAQPHIRTTRTEHVEIEGVWHDVDTFFPWELDNLKVQGCKFRVRVRNQVWFYGVDGETKQWREDYMYGGFQAENIIQAASRCVLDRAMFRVENGGYPIILHAHDEILSEVVKGVGSETDFERLMEVDPKDEPWLAGFPLAVSTWTDTRYVK